MTRSTYAGDTAETIQAENVEAADGRENLLDPDKQYRLRQAKEREEKLKAEADKKGGKKGSGAAGGAGIAALAGALESIEEDRKKIEAEEVSNEIDAAFASMEGEILFEEDEDFEELLAEERRQFEAFGEEIEIEEEQEQGEEQQQPEPPAPAISQ